jgi:hypothetical protein
MTSWKLSPETTRSMGILVGRAVVAVAQGEALAIGVHRQTEFVEGLRAVHRERRLVGVGDGLVGLDQDHAFAEAGDDLPELVSVDAHRHCRTTFHSLIKDRAVTNACGGGSRSDCRKTGIS